jgi:hypothetical protein
MPAAPPRRPDEVRAWLEQEPPLAELQEAYPREWAAVQRQLAEIVPRGDREEIARYVSRLAQGKSANVSQEIRRHMAVAAVRQLSLQAATGVSEGRVRFNLVNGKVAQKLLFKGGGFERKPVSMGAFRLVWPLLWQKRLLMPLVAKKGIYCFYSKPLIAELAGIIGDRKALEIAAGDGTLTRFLRAEGVEIVATDDHSWKDVSFPEDVVREDAKTALKKRAPQVVICSWPPANNDFERAVFTTKSVELYIVIGSRHHFAAGNWATYERQTDFEYQEEPDLSRLVLPPELDAAVYVFQRR